MGMKKRRNTAVSDKNCIDERLKDLLSIKQDILQSAAKDNFDRTDPQYPKEIRKIAARELDNRVSDLKKSKNSNAKELYKFSSHYRKRRENAIVKYAPIFAERFEKKYGNISIESRFIDMCSVSMACLPDIIDEDENITLAVALFILDDLHRNRNIWEAMLYIPDSEELLCDVELPDDFTDAVFENSLIKGMMYLIEHRDDEEDIYFNAVSAKRTEENVPEREYIHSEMYKNYLDDLDKFRADKRAEGEDMSCRERLDKVLSFMQPETVERAEQRFKEKMFEFADILFARYDSFENEIEEAIGRCVDVCDELYSAEERLLKEVQKQEDERRKKTVSRSSILSMKPMEMPQIDMDIAPFGNSFGTSYVPDERDEIEIMLERVNELRDKLEKYDEERADILSERYRYTVFAVNSREGYTFMVDDFEEEAAQLDALRVDNPYETCFAYFSLLDSGSDIVWLVPLAGMMLRLAAELLPWTQNRNEALSDYMDMVEAEEQYDDEEEEEEETEAVPDYIEREARLYTPGYTDYSDWLEEGAKRVKKQDLMQLNFPQLIFKETGLNIPRRTDIHEGRDKGFIKSGISKKNIDFFRMYLEVCCAVDYRIGFDKKRTEETEIDNVENTDTMKSIISAKSDEIVQLKTALHKAENDLRNEKERSEKFFADMETERRELSELRELIYNLRNNIEEEAAPDTEEIHLPYTAQSNIVIFGGHDSWLRAFRPLVKNVRIIDPHTNPDINLIRNADVVWMQSNAMPHSYYNKIMEIVRLRKILVKYFAYASAEKCARQLAAEDMKDKE